MNRLFLVRHGSTDEMSIRLCGRTPGIHLNREGLKQAQKVAESLRMLKCSELLTSPMERAVETTVELSVAAACPVVHSAAFQECDFGKWTGLPFADLEKQPEWTRFNSLRSLLPAPGGESLFDVQYRAVSGIRQMLQEKPDQDHVVVTHADVIRSILCFFAASPLDLHLRYNIRPASLTVLEVSEHAVRIEGINLVSLT